MENLGMKLQRVGAEKNGVVFELPDGLYDLPDTDRLEVISDVAGRLIVRRPVHIRISSQDEGFTLKIFIN